LSTWYVFDSSLRWPFGSLSLSLLHTPLPTCSSTCQQIRSSWTTHATLRIPFNSKSPLNACKN
jgi:hypothetical protein